MRTKTVVIALLVGLLAPRPAHAWGFEAHRLIMERAIALLPEAVRPLFERRRASLVERAIDPDLWRDVFDTEAPNHQVDIDKPEYGPYPYRELPHDYAAAVGKFGVARVRANGTLPWRVEELYGDLRRELEDYGRRPGVVNQEHIVFYAAALVHYISDAHVPFHAVANYDGQMTQQYGIHARFEAFAIARYRDRLTIAPKAIPAIASPRDFTFAALVEGPRLAADVLKADRDAIGDRDVYDDAYYDAFFKGMRPIMERRLNESIAASAAMIAGAWEAAGKPVAVVDLPPAPPQTRRK